MSRRKELLARLSADTFDLLIIGGGIVGAGIARDAAMRGLKVALVEKGDFASGTSSKTSKLIHGGLRYLEHGQLRLVFESLRERRVLRTIAPHLVWPLSLMIPTYQADRRSRWKIGLGLWLYDTLAANGGLRRHRIFSPRAARLHEPGLNRTGLRGAGLYADCQMDDARLCLANILQANSFGASCCNYVKLIAFHLATGRLRGATVEDLRSGEQFSIKAEVVINATGPWSDLIRRESDRHAGTRLAPTKGIHLVVPSLTTHALFFEARRDRRMIFVLPWQGHSIIGTTDSTQIDSLDALRATDDEVDYLLDEVNRILPSAELTPSRILATYAGARPLLAFSGSATGASREHRIDIDDAGLISVMGGKYTTFRVMAQQAVDVAARRLGRSPERCLTHDVSLVESASAMLLSRWQDITRRIAPELLATLLTRYGTGAFRVLQLLEFEPGLIQPVCPHHDYIQAELVFAFQEELACTISDILFRRTTIAYSACQGLDLFSTLIELLRRYGHASQEELDEQAQDYRDALAQGLAFAKSVSHAAPRQPGNAVEPLSRSSPSR